MTSRPSNYRRSRHIYRHPALLNQAGQKMQSGKEAREARRRKILERASDRLAFISGERKFVASPPLNGGEIQEEPSVDLSSMNGSLSESLQDSSKTISSVPNVGDKRESSAVFGSDFSCPGSQARHKRKLFTSTFFTVKRFSCAIDASENARVMCAVGIAILVVIRNVLLAINSPLGAVLNHFFPSWPFSLVILTNITLVMATMLLSSRNTNVIDVIDQTPDETYPTSGAWKLANTIGNVLETFFLLRKVVNAVLIDFSIYFVVLVCGLSLDHH